MKLLFVLLLVSIFGMSAFAEVVLPELKDLQNLQKQFNSDAGKVRIIALLSPT